MSLLDANVVSVPFFTQHGPLTHNTLTFADAIQRVSIHFADNGTPDSSWQYCVRNSIRSIDTTVS